MRLLATLAAVASVNAFFDDSAFLQRSRRNDDDEGCDEGEYATVNGICADTPELAEETAKLMLEDDDAPASSPVSPVSSEKLRKFPIQQGNTPSQFFGGEEEADTRTKRRSQRMTLLLAKVNFGGNLVDKDGKKIRSKDFINQVNQYGCHCWPSETKEHLTGQGKPLDAIDGACWELRQCHKCIGINYPTEEGRLDGCDPVTTKYKAKISRDENNGLSITCANTLNGKKTNNGDCKRSLCECDKNFADAFSATFREWDSDIWKMEEGGTYSNMCQRPAQSSQRLLSSGPDSCCGNYPNVKPFNSATHSCIDGQVSNDNNF